MLVLSRKTNESIQIGDNVTIEIRKIAGNRVTVAINAPREVRILRGELEKAATEFEVEVDESPVAEMPEEASAYSISHSRVRLPRLHSVYNEAQAVG
jgi:carbon storage regulator